MNCDFCGSCGEMTATSKPIGVHVKKNGITHYCDISCANAHLRETTRDVIIDSLQHLKHHYETEIDSRDHLARKFCVIKKLFLESLLERKPRAELIKLVELRKRVICEVTEIAHEWKDDGLTFKLGEMFKKKDEWLIDAWCRP
jgi:hypothetical protein